MVLCEVSCKFFSGFQTQVDLNYIDNKEEICNQVKRDLINTLQINKFRALINMVEKINFHIHDMEFGKILLMRTTDTIWICNHVHKESE